MKIYAKRKHWFLKLKLNSSFFVVAIEKTTLFLEFIILKRIRNRKAIQIFPEIMILKNKKVMSSGSEKLS